MYYGTAGLLLSGEDAPSVSEDSIIIYEKEKNMDILSALMGSLASQESVSALEQKSGASGKQIMSLVSQALPLLLGALQNNASSQAGANSLLGALSQHTNTAPVPLQLQQADTIDGAKILAHILGGNSASLISQLASSSGMQANQANNVLASLAPALMSSMSQMTNNTGSQPGLDLGSLSSLMGSFNGSSMLGGANVANLLSGGDLSSLLGAAMGQQAAPQQQEPSLLNTVLGLFK